MLLKSSRQCGLYYLLTYLPQATPRRNACRTREAVDAAPYRGLALGRAATLALRAAPQLGAARVSCFVPWAAQYLSPIAVQPLRCRAVSHVLVVRLRELPRRSGPVVNRLDWRRERD